MKSTKPALLAIGLAALGLLGVGLYQQHVQEMFPCPYCVLQRYAFFAIAAFSLAAAALPPRAARIGAGLGLLSALTGIGLAARLVWIQAHPSVSCGIDPLETALNKIPSAKLMPWLFRADGFCTTEYPPLLGLSTPQWALVWFVILALALGWAVLRRPR
ncbi:MAG TPA: disulfide bond formation protein B [Paucimonas sp.]|nr:disulfide bond formation protein B [Paucimonas sp.]